MDWVFVLRPCNCHPSIERINQFSFQCGRIESVSELVLRLQEMFEDLEAVPGPSAIVFGDTQKINYLLSAIKHERSLQPVYVQIQTDQLRGRITFEQACDDLRYRCESNRADELLNAQVKPAKVRGYLSLGPDLAAPADESLGADGTSGSVALITSASKRQNLGPETRAKKTSSKEQNPCLATGCSSTVPPHIRLCRMHFHECIAGKQANLPLRTGGTAHYDASTNKIVYPSSGNTKLPTKKVSIKVGVASPLPLPAPQLQLNLSQTDSMLENLIQATDKYEAAMAMQPEAVISRTRTVASLLPTPKVQPLERDKTLSQHQVHPQVSLRINNTSHTLAEWGANGKAGVADCTLHPSSPGVRAEERVQSVRVARPHVVPKDSCDVVLDAADIPPAYVSCLSCVAPVFSLVFHVDSGAGQSLCCCEDAFVSLRACAIEVMGVSGSLPVYGVGTAAFLVRDGSGDTSLLLLHNCLLTKGGEFNLISVSQMQMPGLHSVDFASDLPQLHLRSTAGLIHVPMQLTDGLYSVVLEPVSINDIRYLQFSQVDLTSKDDYTPPTVGPPTRLWSCRTLVAPSSRHRVLAFPTIDGPAFGAHLQEFCQQYLAPLSIPPARQTYDVGNVVHMSDLSVRFMGTSNDKLHRTVELNRGLTPATGRVPTLNFPQGKFRQGKTPKVRKDKVHHLHRASICEVVFTDTFETGDHHYRYGQAFVDYRSRWGDVIPLKSRKQVGWSFGEFICRNFTPLILVRDNIAENRGGALMDKCHRRGVQSAYICPYTPQQDQAENYLGRVTAMASYAMVYAGAPLFFWRWAIQAAVFISNITATFYSREQVWSTPYTLVFGEPFPDAAIVVPFGCGALVLLDKDDRAKFHSRCALLVFVHYATSHPMYTYAFYSPRTKKILFRQDPIFLVNHFPMRMARTAAGLSADGETFATFRSPLGFPNIQDDLSFQTWTPDEPLPTFDDHVSGSPLEDISVSTRDSSVECPPDWPRRFPHHEAFGPCSTVAVPVPPSFPTSSVSVVLTPADLFGQRQDVLADAATCHNLTPQESLGGMSPYDLVYRRPQDSSDSSPAFSPDVDLSTATKDKDMSRGMGHLLHNPTSFRSLLPRGSAPNLGPSIFPSTLDTPVRDALPPVIPFSERPTSSHEFVSDRVLRSRTKRDRLPTSPPPTFPPVKRSVKDRWFYEKIPTLPISWRHPPHRL
jgi:hypothetical protein